MKYDMRVTVRVTEKMHDKLESILTTEQAKARKNFAAGDPSLPDVARMLLARGLRDYEREMSKGEDK